MTDWNKGQLVLLAGACIAVFGSVYFLAARGPEPVARVPAATRPEASARLVTPTRISPAEPFGNAAPAAIATSEPARTIAERTSPADERLRQMAENPTADDVAYLDGVAQREGDARLRVMAIEGLQRAAISGSDNGASSRALRQIASSADPQISHAARRAISQIGARSADD